MQIALVGTMGMKVTVRQKGGKDYAILSVERMVFISFVTNAFFKTFFCVLFMLTKCFCEYFCTVVKMFMGFLVWHWYFGCGEPLIFRSAK